MARVELLLFLAKHLREWPKVNEAINRALNKTRSIFVDLRRKEIKSILDAPSGSDP
jgi:hypothetical protein